MTRRAPRRAAPGPRARVGRCPDGSRIWAYLDGELSAAGTRAMARHVTTCAACGPRALRLRAWLESCRTAGCRQLPPEVRRRAKARVRALLAGGPKKS